jgi:hypothetical protein
MRKRRHRMNRPARLLRQAAIEGEQRRFAPARMRPCAFAELRLLA